MVLCLSQSLGAQTLVGGSIFSPPTEASQSNQLWFKYQNSFEFKKRMFIDSDFGHIFNTNNRAKRLSVRSVFKYQIADNLKIGSGMGFFWYYDKPELVQELRFVQEINYMNDFGSSIMYHDLRLEEQIIQGVITNEDFKARVRYQVGLTFPTPGPMYFGIYDEIFKNLSEREETPSSFFAMNRAGAMIGYNTYQQFRIEAHLTMEDRYEINSNNNTRSIIFTLTAKQII